MKTRHTNEISELFTREVVEQPDRLDALAEQYAKDPTVLERTRDTVRSCRGSVYLVGMGNSESSARTALWTFTKNNISTAVREGGEFLHYGLADLRPDDLVVFISVSGLSAEIVGLNNALPSTVRRILITNNPDSPMAKSTPYVLPMHTGEEQTTASKTYMNTVALMELLAVPSLRDGLQSIRHLAGEVRKAQSRLETERDAVAEFVGHPDTPLEILGRGPGFGVANYGSLILRELYQTKVLYFPAGTYRHGPILDAGAGNRIIIISQGKTRDLSDALARELAELGETVLLIRDGIGPAPSAKNLKVIECPTENEDHFKFLAGLVLANLAIAWTFFRPVKFVRRITTNE